MPDHFAILAQPRRPWLDGEVLKEAFHRATAEQHPDVAGGSQESASTLSAAYAVLRDPALRLRHLLELEWPSSATVQVSIAPALADRFGKIAVLRQTGAALAKRASTAQTPIARALLAGEQARHLRALEATLAELASAEMAAHDDLRSIDARWAARDDQTPNQLAALQQRFAFLAKWQAQLREDLFRLGV